MKIVISGAGVAGLTLAALLSNRSAEVSMVDRRDPGADLGYAISLWPHGSRVLHAVGAHRTFVARSEPMLSYTASGPDEQVLTSSPVPAGVAAYGHVGLVDRGELIRLLRAAAPDVPLRTGVTLDALAPAEDKVAVRFSDGTTDVVDLVIGADGIGSRVRALVLGRVPYRDTGWRCLVWWVDPELGERGAITERFGVASFLGTYPTRERLCVIAGVPAEVLDGPAELRNARVVERLVQYGPQNDALVRPLCEDPQEGHVWPMTDVRAPRWTDGRVVLVGDAAAAFLPTAGIGASMALESAAVLADELSRSDRQHLPQALALYERRRRRRVEAAQTQSRRLATMMFRRSPVICRLRNRVLRLTSMEHLVAPLIADLRRPI